MPRKAGITEQDAQMNVHVVAGIIFKENKLLLAQRPEGKPYSGFWEFPGGKVEAGEKSKAALVRELHEELGIVVVSSKHLFNHTYAYPDKTVDLEIWLTDDFVGEPISKENQFLRWVTFAEMKGLGMALLEGNRPIVEKLEDLGGFISCP